MRTVICIVVALGALTLAGCAARSRGVPIEDRPTPAQPVQVPTPGGVPAPGRNSPGQPAEPSTTDPRQELRARVVADTTSARQVVGRCARTTLLPEQEASLESLRDLLRRARVALIGEDLGRAESLARQARQVASSLDCGK